MKLRLRPVRSPACLVFLLGAVAAAAQAQTAPDAGALLRQIEQQRPAPPPAPAPARTPPPPPLATAGELSVTVGRFVFAGNTLLSAADLGPAVAGFTNRPLSFAELQRAAAAVGEAYRDAGWVVRAYLPQQDITAGTVTIQVVEAVFGSVRIQGEAVRVGSARLERIVGAVQATGQPLRAPALDRALLLIDDLPGLSARGSLTEGQREAETDLLLQVSDGPLFSGDLGADNTGSRSTGSARLTASLSVNSPTERADQVQAMLMQTEGSSYARLGYALPLGHRGWRVTAHASHLRYRLVAPEFAATGARGTSTTAGLDLHYPWLRSRSANVYLALSLEDKRFDNRSGGVVSTHYGSRSATATVSAQRFDEWRGSGSTAASLGFTAGDVDLSGSPNEAADAASARTAGGYTRLRFALSRQQTLNPRWQLSASLNGQWASKNLDSSERFYLGGAGGVRAYPASEGGGSEGLLFSLELRHRISEALGVAAFVDRGEVRVNRDNAFTGAPALNRYALQGAGVSVNWVTPVGVSLKATLASRIGGNPNPTATGRDQDGTLVRQRLWLQASLPF